LQTCRLADLQRERKQLSKACRVVCARASFLVLCQSWASPRHFPTLASALLTHYSLLITHYSLLTTHYSLLTTHYSLFTTHYSLLATHYSRNPQPATRSPQPAARTEPHLSFLHNPSLLLTTPHLQTDFATTQTISLHLTSPLQKSLSPRSLLPRAPIAFPLSLRYCTSYGEAHYSIPAVTQTSLPPWSTHLVKTHHYLFICCSNPVSQLPDGHDRDQRIQSNPCAKTNCHPVPGLIRPPTAKIPSPHSLAAILSPSAPPEDPTAGGSRASTPKRTHAEAFSPSDQSYLHPASPSHHRASIASTGEPSPGARGADDGSIGVMRGGFEEKKPQKMVRSSIACARCRRSKVKCELI
jgi:hypothetical protein